ncbi:MAG: HAMP domain-containing histidine kinase [Oscillospiraceae bacterium]|jgi:signal transduction histidine kinase|nr:HAMP domain-containing histidine kinase [Oscillospiraceae bacterium]
MGTVKSGGQKLLKLHNRWLRGSVLIVLKTLLKVIGIFAYFVYNYYYSTIRTGLESKAKTATDFFANYVAKSYSEFYDSAYRYAETFKDGDSMELQFVDTEGRVMISTSGVTSGTIPSSPDVTDSINTRKISVWTGKRTITGEHVIAVSAPMIYSGNQVIGVMRYVTSLERVDRLVLVNILAVVGIGAVIMLIVVFINMVFIRSVIAPMGDITRVSKRIADGSYGIQIDNTYNDEIGEMVESINEMSMKIAQTEKLQTEFISSISHELRTPLTAITGWGETLVYDENISGDAKRGIAIILKEARRLTNMVEELLEFTRIEDGRFTLNIEMIDIAAELEDAIFTYSELLHQGEIEFDYTPYTDDMPLIPGDPSRLKQVFLNLFDNAAKYARDGKRISVSLALEASFAVICIRDHGPGIPDDELEIVKMKFYKGSNSKERGSGIGLAVSDEIIRYHGGALELSNASGGGLAVTVSLPVTT